MKIHIRGSGAPELTRIFERSFESQLPKRSEVTYDWSSSAATVPPGWLALQRALEGAVIPKSGATQAPNDPSSSDPGPKTDSTEIDSSQTQATRKSSTEQTAGSILEIRAQQTRK